MSLFPCHNRLEYDSNEHQDSATWLKASSFNPELVVVQEQQPTDVSLVQQTQVTDSKVHSDRASSEHDVKEDDSQISVSTRPRKESKHKTSKHGHKEKKSGRDEVRARKHVSKSKRGKIEKRGMEKIDRRHRSRSRSASPVKLLPPPRKIFLEEMRDLGYKDAYRLDREKDRDNYSFQSLNKKHISRYRNFSKTPFGVRPAERSLWFKKNSDRHKPVRYYSKPVRVDVYSAGDFLQPNLESKITEALPSTINLHSKQDSDSEAAEHNPLGILDKSTALWSQGKAPASTVTQDDVTGGSTDDTSFHYLTSTLTHSIASLNRELRTDPHNSDKWLQLISIQDGLLQHRTEGDGTRLFTQQNIVDKKLAIITQAINKNPSDIKLKLKHLELCSHSHEADELVGEWRKLTFTHINDIQVWRGYLNHVKNSFNRFSMSVVVKAYTKCIKSLRNVSLGLLKSHPCKQDTVKHMLGILLELCTLLHLANCTEKAVALIQAMLEFNVNRPIASGKRHEEAIESFQEFYDSGVPRFGEPGARGWDNYSSDDENNLIRPAPLKPTVAQDAEEEERILSSHQTLISSTRDVPTPDIPTPDIPTPHTDRSSVWSDLEKSRQISHWLPWRPASQETDDDCEDPHRLVLSDDIIDLLFYVNDETVRIEWCFDVLAWFGLKLSSQSKTDDNVGYKHWVISGVNQLSRSPVTPANHCHVTQWYQYLLNDLFISHVTEQLMSKLTGGDKSKLVQLKLQQQYNQVLRTEDKKEKKRRSKEFRNYAKSILSLHENRNNVELWLCYVSCNRELDLYADASNVLDVLINSNSVDNTVTIASRSHLAGVRCAIWWSYVQLEVKQRSHQKILKLVWWLVYGVSLDPSPYQKLILIRDLESMLEERWGMVGCSSAEAIEDFSIFTHLLLSYCLAQVLVNGSSALDQAVNHWLSVIDSRSITEHYNLSAMFIQLSLILKYVCLHIYQSCTPLLRSVLQRSLTDYPQCTALLDEYLDVERRAHVTTRVRQFFTSNLLPHNVTSDIVTPSMRSCQAVDMTSDMICDREVLAVYSVLFELEKLELLKVEDDISGGGEVITNRGINNRIRSVCERSVSTVCPKSVLMWRLYMYHENVYGSRTKLESIFYSAIQACPYAKCLYTDAILYMADKLSEILDIAEEKEVRIHTPLDELDILIHQ